MPGLPLPLAPRAGGTITAPTFIQEAEVTTWLDATSPKTSTFNALTNDVLVAYSMTENNSSTVAISNNGTPLTWAQQQVILATNFGWLSIWTTILPADRTGLIVSFTETGTGFYGGNVLTVRGSSGVGVSVQAHTTGTASVSITPSQANSLIVVPIVDWAAVDGASRAWLTNAGAFSELTYARDAGGSHYAVYGGYHANAGTAVAKTVGLSAPSGQTYSIAAIEIKGIASGGTLFTRTLTATQASAVARVVQANVPRSITQASTATVVRRGLRDIVAGVGNAVAMTRSAGKPLNVTQATTATIITGSVFQKVLAATSSVATSIIKRASVIRGITQASTATNPRAISATRAVTEPVTPSITKADRTTIQTMQGTSPVANKQAQLPRIVTVGSLGSLLRRAGKVAAVTQATSASLPQRTISKLVTVVGTIAPVMSAARTYLFSLLATQGSSATAIKRANIARSAAQTSTGTATRRTGTVRSANLTSNVTVPRLISKFIAASQASSTSLVARNVILRTLSVAVNSVTAMAKRAGSTRTAPQSTAIATSFRTSKTTAATQATSATVNRRTARSFLATQASVATITIQNVVLRTLTAVVGASTSVARRVNATRSVVSTPVASRLARIVRSISAQQATTASAIKQARVSKSVTTTGSVSLISSLVRTLVLQVVQGVSANIRRSISRQVMVTQPTTTTASRRVAKALGAVVGIVPTIATAKRVVLVLAVQVSSVASIVRQKIIHVTDFVTRGLTRTEGRHRHSEAVGRPHNSRVRSIRRR